MKGGYDLYGNYYPNEMDAINAEMTQCNEIDQRYNKQALDNIKHDYAREIYYLNQRIDQLEEVINELKQKS